MSTEYKNLARNLITNVFVRPYKIVDLCLSTLDDVSTQTKNDIKVLYFACADTSAILRRIYAYDDLHAAGVVLAMLKNEASEDG